MDAENIFPLPYERTKSHELEIFATATLYLNLFLLLFAGALPQGTVGQVARYGATVCSVALILFALPYLQRPAFRVVAYLFAPYAIVGLLAAILGLEPLFSLNRFVRWGFSISTALIIGSLFEESSSLAIILKAMTLAICASIFTSLVFPEIGTEVYIGRVAWRGLAGQKNGLGWTAALGILVAIRAGSNQSKTLRLILFLGSIVAIAGSLSAGNFTVICATLCYFVFMLFICKRASLGAIVILEIVLLTVVVAAWFLFGEDLLSALGRDLTFTGRTDIWSAYLQTALQRWPLGHGLGMLTSETPITAVLLDNYQFPGRIFQPHNAYIGHLGDVGILGLATYVILYFNIAFILPVKNNSSAYRTCGMFTFATLWGGITEVHEVYIDGIGAFLIALSAGWAAQSRDRSDRF